jgi:ABC-type polysaccharide/polyol phosphate export permease
MSVKSQESARPRVIDGLAIMAAGGMQWRIWHLLGTSELRGRYSRSRLGQAWLSLSTAITIGTLGFVWSFLWKQPMADMMPWIGTGLIVWTCVNASMTECTTILSAHGKYYLNQKMVMSVSILAVIYKNSIILLYNLPIVVLLVVAFGVPVNGYTLELVPAMILFWLTMVCAGYVVAMVCTRFRDVAQLVSNGLQVAFFVTPVLWKPDFLESHQQFIVTLNPFALYVDLLRRPLLGQPVAAEEWLAALAITAVGGLTALWLIGRYERRIIYWV